MFDNETIQEIRDTRKEISTRFGYDPKRLVEYYKEKQKTRVKSKVSLTNVVTPRGKNT